VSSKLTDKQKASISNISGLVLVNAMIFQEVLSESEKRVYSLQKILNQENPQNAFISHWNFIITEINYYPIFHVASSILSCLTSNKDILNALEALVSTAQKIVSMRAPLRHDLMGRIYHRLLVEAKYLGTYYTSIPAATLLLKLALSPSEWDVNWCNLEELSKLRVADLACGTGTLLMATADSITDNYIRQCAENESAVDLNRLNNILAEKILYGYDVLPSAIHLTASTVALRAPEITFIKMNLFNMELGGDHYRLGSLEFLKHMKVTMVSDLFGSVSEVKQATGKHSKEIVTATVPELDLCVMNPPFTRSVGGNLLFGSLPKEERAKMQKELKRLVDENKLFANITAGLGSVFAAIGDQFIKEGGRIALVLPKALISGVAWEKTRELLKQKYQVEYIVASHDPARWNFSESTSLSEVLLVAKKKPKSESTNDGLVKVVNLWYNPLTSFESLLIATELLRGSPPELAQQGALNIVSGGLKLGEAIAFPWNDLRKMYTWMLPCSFAQSDLIRAAYYLIKGELWLPGHKEQNRIPLCQLSKLGVLGPDRRDIHDGFGLSKTATAYPAYIGHNATIVNQIELSPNIHLQPLSRPKKGRPLRKAEDLWAISGKLLIGERLWLNTIRLVSIRMTEKVLSNVWWSFSFFPEIEGDEIEKSLALWLNSTLGIIILLANRVETRGAWVDFKKPILRNMPVLDVISLTPKQRQSLVAAYNEISKKVMLPLPQMNGDKGREEIDYAIAEVLGLQDYSIFRKLLAQEPLLSLSKLR